MRGRQRLLLLTIAASAATTLFAAAVAGSRPVSLRVLPMASQLALWFALAVALLFEALAWIRVRRSGVPGAWVWRAGFATAVAGTAVWLVYAAAFKPLFLLLHWGIAGGAFAALVFGGPSLARCLPARLRRALDFAAFAIAAVAVTAEIGLRAIAAVVVSPVFARASTPERQIARHRCAPGELRFGYPCNSRGFYDEEPVRAPNQRFVAVVGDSFSVGVVPHWFHYTTVGERELADTTLYNIGVTTIGPAEYLLLVAQEALPHAPDAVVVALFVGNDVWDSLRYHDDHALLREVFDRSRVQLVQVPRRILELRAERARVGRDPGTIAGENAVVRGSDDPAELVAKLPALADPMREVPTFSVEAYRNGQYSRIAAACNPADLRGYRCLFTILDELRALCGPTPLRVMLIPDEFQVEDSVWREALAGRADDVAYERDMPQRLIGDWLRAAGVPFLDLLPIARAVPPLADGDRHLYLLRDSHFNVRGNEVAGRALAAFLR